MARPRWPDPAQGSLPYRLEHGTFHHCASSGTQSVTPLPCGWQSGRSRSPPGRCVPREPLHRSAGMTGYPVEHLGGGCGVHAVVDRRQTHADVVRKCLRLVCTTSRNRSFRFASSFYVRSFRKLTVCASSNAAPAGRSGHRPRPRVLGASKATGFPAGPFQVWELLQVSSRLGYRTPVHLQRVRFAPGYGLVQASTRPD